MEYKNIEVSLSNHIQFIMINRPKQLNALNRATFNELEDVFKQIYLNNDIKIVIITGAGEKAFVAGADIKEFASFSQKEAEQLSANGQRIFKLIEDCPKPVIAAVNGFALGGGCELSMACHLRVAADNAKFSQPEVSLGVTPGYAGTQRLVQLIGKTKAIEMLITGDMINAEQALKFGLVNYVVPLSELMSKTIEIGEKIMARSPVAIAGILKSVNAFFAEGENGFEQEVKEFGKCFISEDFKEGTAAFLEKRKPQFQGK
ncbi:MAG: enoyl-CoA hydratase [Chlorobi bacterium]|nr:enoyl-CoA hydratase [Chlorobiota bacterium]